MNNEERRQKLEALTQELEARAAEVGLYAQTAVVLAQPEEDVSEEESAPATLIVNFLIGDRAWSDAVQNPEQVDFDKQFRMMAADLEDDEFDEYRKRLLGGDQGGSGAQE